MATPANDIERLIDVFAQEVQELEGALLQILTDTLIATSVGVQLDNLGTIIGLGREGLSDAVYRARLRAQILVNRSNGGLQELINIVNAFFDSAETFTIVESFTGFDIEITSDLTPEEAVWAPSTAYLIGDRVTNQGNVYEATIAGTSAASGLGPTGTGDVIVDGTVTWAYQKPAVGEGDVLALLIRQARSAGVNGYVTFQVTTPLFAFDGAGGSTFDGGSFFRTSLG